MTGMLIIIGNVETFRDGEDVGAVRYASDFRSLHFGLDRRSLMPGTLGVHRV